MRLVKPAKCLPFLDGTATHSGREEKAIRFPKVTAQVSVSFSFEVCEQLPYYVVLLRWVPIFFIIIISF